MKDKGHLVVASNCDGQRYYAFMDSESAHEYAGQPHWKSGTVLQVVPLQGGDMVKTVQRYRTLLDNVIEEVKKDCNDKEAFFRKMEHMGFCREDFRHFGFSEQDLDDFGVQNYVE